MATRLIDQYFETVPMPKEVSADDIRREHEEALRSGPSHPEYERARYFGDGAENASGNLDSRPAEELRQEMFEALAETRNRRLHLY